MQAKESFLITFRVVFVLFSSNFAFSAAKKWDGLSSYVPFFDFLPELSYAFILWSFLGFVFATVLWIFLLLTSKILPDKLRFLKIEYLMMWLLLSVTFYYLKVNYIAFPPREFIDIARNLFYAAAMLFMALPVWLIRKYVPKTLHSISSSIAAIFWFFIILLIIAVPASTIKRDLSVEINAADEKVEPLLSFAEKPNIIFVTMDSLAAHDMGVYGYGRQTTPFISEWAKDSIVFNRLYAASTWTPPTVTSLMTGQYPWTHRVWHNTRRYNVRSNDINFPSLLKKQGYSNYAFVQVPHAHPDATGMGRVFEVKDEFYSFWLPGNSWFSRMLDSSFFLKRPIARDWFYTAPVFQKVKKIFDLHRNTTQYPPYIVYDRFFDHMSQNSETPFFAWIHLDSPHHPYLAPEPYMGVYGDKDKYNTDMKQSDSFTFFDYKAEDQSEVDILRKRYDETILYSDKQFEVFMTRLPEVVDMSNTIIILSSDHGESFEDMWLAHVGPFLYEQIVNIPLIIKMPDNYMSRQKGGEVIDMPIGQIDIAPTILELAGVMVPDWMEGRSFLPLLNNEKIEPKPVYSMHFSVRYNRSVSITNGAVAVWDGDYKLTYILHEGSVQLYNLSNDPDERNDISVEMPDITQRLKKLIDDNISETNRKRLQGG